MVELARMYEEGHGGLPKDDVQAVTWYRKAAESGDSTGMRNLAKMYDQGRGDLPKDKAQAESWNRKADKVDADNADFSKKLGLKQ